MEKEKPVRYTYKEDNPDNQTYRTWYKLNEFIPREQGWYWVEYAIPGTNQLQQGLATWVFGTGFSKENVTAWRLIT